MTNKSCDLDPMPTSLVNVAIDLVNKSLTSGVISSCYKEARVTLMLKKPSLDSEALKEYHPISNLTFISKILKRAVASRLHACLKRNNLLQPCQSA